MQSNNTQPTKEELAMAYNSIRKQSPWTNDALGDVVHHRVLPHATYSPWLSDESFKEVYSVVKDFTLVDIYRCYELWTLSNQLLDVEGDVLEVGVWRGGTGALIASALKNSEKKVFLADTFTGVVKASNKDTNYKGGEHADTSLETVMRLNQQLNLTNTLILQGIFPEDTAHRVSNKLSFVHCDVDVYESAKDIIDWSTPRLSRGGMIVFDDYGFSGCDGVTRLVNELRTENVFFFVHNLNGHAIFIKK